MPDKSPLVDIETEQDPNMRRDIEDASHPVESIDGVSGSAEGDDLTSSGSIEDVTVEDRISEEFRAKVEEVIRVIRPAVQADDGDIFLRDVDATTGVVSVELVGACVTCPASTQTLKQGLERILKDRVEGVSAVEHVGEELLGFEEGTPVSL